MTKTTKSIIHKYCDKCKYHHPDDDSCPQVESALEKYRGKIRDEATVWKAFGKDKYRFTANE